MDPSSTAVPNDEKSSKPNRALQVIAFIAIALTIFWIIQINHNSSVRHQIQIFVFQNNRLK